MKHRVFGRAGAPVSEIGYGGWGIGGSWWGKADDAAALAALRRAVELGIDVFDTALVYGWGHGEKLMGRAIREAGRDRIFVASKVPPKDRRWPARNDTPAADAFSGDWIARCAETSLENLGVERLDLLQFHVWSDRWMEETDVWLPAVQGLKAAGKVRFWGVSLNDHEPDNGLKLVASGLADSVQVIYNVFDQAPAARLLPLCREKGVAVIVRCPFDEGSLTGAFTPDTRFDEGDFRRNYFNPARMPEVLSRVEALRPLLAAEGRTMPQGALKFCLSHPAVTTVIPGMRRVSRVEENVRAADGAPLSPALLDELKSHAWARNFYAS
jgi:aryl-alcohol dehydrogenase-like predicted oxidoreductase